MTLVTLTTLMTDDSDHSHPSDTDSDNYGRDFRSYLLTLLHTVLFCSSTIRNLYAHCVQSEEGQHLGCVTDRMGDGSYLTVPVYATICSAMCYESKANMERVKKCPYPGFRKHNPILSKLF